MNINSYIIPLGHRRRHREGIRRQ